MGLETDLPRKEEIYVFKYWLHLKTVQNIFEWFGGTLVMPTYLFIEIIPHSSPHHGPIHSDLPPVSLPPRWFYLDS